jgi:GntR family transcriptional regulator of vanillate catabolism
MRGYLEFVAFSGLNVVFHRLLAGRGGWVVIRREAERVTRLPFAAPSAFLLDRADIAVFQRTMETAQQQHRELLAAIAAREGTRAEALAREHARTARRNLDYVLEEDRSLIGHLPGLALVLD